MTTKIKILIAEHDPVDLELIHHELMAGGTDYISGVVKNEQDYIDALTNFIPDIILADYTFPSFDGPHAFKIKQKMAPATPFIFVSGTIGEEKSIELIKNGLTDYVLKDKLFTLNFKVHRALKEANETQQKKIAEQKLILNERLLTRAQHMAHMGNWELDFKGNMVYCSDETCRIYALTPGKNSMSYESMLAFIHPDDLAVVNKKINESRDLQVDLFLHYRIIFQNGTLKHLYSEGKLDYDSNGIAIGLYGIVRDITQTVLLENELAKERRARESEITAAVLEAQENERAHIGRELHDNLNQVLGAAKMYIELAKTDVINRPTLLAKSTVHIVSVIAEIRKISKLLASPGKQLGLFESIKNLLADLAIIHPVKFLFHHNNADEILLNEKLQLTIFRIVQEQVNNILKHANASSAEITIKKEDQKVALFISDNGIGSDSLKQIEGVGIRNIISRADLYNGKVTIVSNPGEGYKLEVVLTMNTYVNKEESLKRMLV